MEIDDTYIWFLRHYQSKWGLVKSYQSFKFDKLPFTTELIRIGTRKLKQYFLYVAVQNKISFKRGLRLQLFGPHFGDGLPLVIVNSFFRAPYCFERRRAKETMMQSTEVGSTSTALVISSRVVARTFYKRYHFSSKYTPFEKRETQYPPYNHKKCYNRFGEAGKSMLLLSTST